MSCVVWGNRKLATLSTKTKIRGKLFTNTYDYSQTSLTLTYREQILQKSQLQEGRVIMTIVGSKLSLPFRRKDTCLNNTTTRRMTNENSSARFVNTYANSGRTQEFLKITVE